MAILDDILFTGTYGDICFYQVAGATFARKKSSLTRKRVLKDKEFEKTRKYAGDLGTASRIASAIYKTLPADIKGRWIFRAIAGDAASMLYKGKSEAEVKTFLNNKYVGDINTAKQETSATTTTLSSTKKANLQWQKYSLTVGHSRESLNTILKEHGNIENGLIWAQYHGDRNIF
jgi:hypothetical protein